MQESNKEAKLEATNDVERATQHFPISKKELKDLIDKYKTRTFDEEITACAAHGGVEGLADKLKVDIKVGLTGSDFPDRTEQFGNNYREPLKAKMWI